MIHVAMFDVKPYDRDSFEPLVGEDIRISYFDTKLSAETASLAYGAECVCCFVNDTIDARTIELLAEHGVRLIALRCAGFNQVDVHAAYGRIHVVRVPAYSPSAVAEHTVALLLTSVRRIHKAYNRTREYNFSIAGLTGENLEGKTVGVIGAGKIGRAFIRICRGFGMRVLAYDKYPSDEVDAEFVTTDRLFAESDIISLHCPLTEENYHLINAENMQKMKRGVILLNTSRGALIDADALLDGIKSKQIGAACLDVYEEESELFFDDRSGHILHDDTLARLLSMPNVIVTSHQAFLTVEALDEIAKTTMDNIRAFFRDGVVKNEICYHCGKVEACKQSRSTSCF